MVGILLLGHKVMHTVGKEVIMNIDFMKAFSVQFATAFVIGLSTLVHILSSTGGIDTSGTICVIGALHGVREASRQK